VLGIPGGDRRDDDADHFASRVEDLAGEEIRAGLVIGWFISDGEGFR
jgi:hypothetical protein